MRFHGLRHPREMGGPEVEAFLAWLSSERRVSVSTHRQALLGHSDVSTTMVYTHVLRLGGGAVRSPLEALAAREPATVDSAH